MIQTPPRLDPPPLTLRPWSLRALSREIGRYLLQSPDSVWRQHAQLRALTPAQRMDIGLTSEQVRHPYRRARPAASVRARPATAPTTRVPDHGPAVHDAPLAVPGAPSPA